MITDPGAPLPSPPRDATIELAGVTARYPGSPRPVLEQVDLRLEPGGRVALVGPSGSGKTTVTNVLLRFLDPEEGALLFDGYDARDHRQSDVRAMFSLAGQGAHLFNSTIRQNLLLARPDATEDELRAVLARARLAAWVDGLPDGIDTLVGEEGRRLSGGQRQRLVLARALLRDAPVLVLDEPTAHLDADHRRGADGRRVRRRRGRRGAADHASQRGPGRRRPGGGAGCRPGDVSGGYLGAVRASTTAAVSPGAAGSARPGIRCSSITCCGRL